eukprot:Sdes_comp20843_c0_seq1m17548
MGPSMMPTINSEGDILLIECISSRKKALKKGDIVISKSPSEPRNLLCKRITAMPGEKIMDQNTLKWVRIPKGHLWLAGDNKLNSTDSRTYGPVPYALIQGRVVFRVWPLRQFGFLSPASEAFHARDE